MNGSLQGLKNLWRDRRGHAHKKMIVALFLYIFIFLTTLAYGASSMNEQASDVIALVLVLVGTIQGLVSYIYITGIKDLKSSIEKLFEEDRRLEERKLDKTDHTILCGKVNVR